MRPAAVRIPCPDGRDVHLDAGILDNVVAVMLRSYHPHVEGGGEGRVAQAVAPRVVDVLLLHELNELE